MPCAPAPGPSLDPTPPPPPQAESPPGSTRGYSPAEPVTAKPPLPAADAPTLAANASPTLPAAVATAAAAVGVASTPARDSPLTSRSLYFASTGTDASDPSSPVTEAEPPHGGRVFAPPAGVMPAAAVPIADATRRGGGEVGGGEAGGGEAGGAAGSRSRPGLSQHRLASTTSTMASGARLCFKSWLLSLHVPLWLLPTHFLHTQGAVQQLPRLCSLP